MTRTRGQNIDADFAQAMRSIGGLRPSEVDPACTVGANADIVFPQQGVIAEVKTLLDDPRLDKGYEEGLRNLYIKWIGQGKVQPPTGSKLLINSDTLPKECGRELMRWTMKSLQRGIKHANRQIRNLKQSLQMPDARGLLVVCNSGVPYFTPHMILHELHHALNGKQFRSIDWLIYMTFGLPVSVPGVPEPADIMSPPHALGRDEMPPEIFKMISEAWFNHLPSLRRVYRGSDSLSLFDAKHIE